MDALSLFGLFAVTGMLICYALEGRSGWYVLGFAPQTGGAISLIDQVGIKKFVAECDDFAKKYGAQFEVPKLLRDMAAKGESFYGKYQPAKAA